MSTHMPAYGGELVDLLVDAQTAEELKEASRDFQTLTLSMRQQCDLELLVNGAFSPLDGFMDSATWQSVLDNGTLPSGVAWPMPIGLEIPANLAEKLSPGDRLALRDVEGFMPAVLEVSEVWQPDMAATAAALYGSNDPAHPGVADCLASAGSAMVGGRLLGIELPTHYEFEDLWRSPAELRALFHKLGWRRVLGFQTSSLVHRRERDLIVEQAKALRAHILLHPLASTSRPGWIDYVTRVHCYQASRPEFPQHLNELSLLPLAPRFAGERELQWRAIVAQNYGCTHLIVAGDGSTGMGEGEGEHLVKDLSAPIDEQAALHVSATLQPEQVYVEDKGYMARSEAAAGSLPVQDFTPADLKQALHCGTQVPDWFSYPGVIKEMRRVYPDRAQQGITLFFTGLSGSGKSTLAKIIYAKLVELGSRPVTLLDGDIVRLNLSSELGFSKAHRDLNIRRIGFVASEITKNGGVAICAPIAPYAETRRAVRELIEQYGAYLEIHVATPLETCESRDRKGLYAKARQGIIKEFTGISDPYEVPEKPEIRVDTTGLTPTEAAQEIFLYLTEEGYLGR